MFLKYAFGQQFAVFIRALQEIIVRGLLPPEKMAVWNLVTIVANTFTMFQANVVAASYRLLTQSRGKNASVERLISIRGNSIFLEILQQTILSCVLLLVAPLIWEAPIELEGLFYYCAAAVMITNGMTALLTGVHESSSIFGRLGILLPINALTQAITVFLGAYFYELPGLVVGAIIGLCLNVVFMFVSMRLMNMRWYTHLDSKISKDLGRTAISFRVADLPTTVFYFSDAIVASFWLEPEGLALYMTARLLVNFSTQVIFAVNRTSLTGLGIKIGAQQNVKEIANYLSTRFVYVYLVIMPALFAIAEPAIRWALPNFLSDYEGSLTALPYLLLTALTSSRALLLRNYWIQRQEWRKIMYSGLVGTVGMAVTLLIGMNWFEDIGINELALLTLIGQIPYTLFIIIEISRSEQILKHFIYRLSAFIFSFMCIFAVFQFNGSIGQEKIGTIVNALQQIGVGFLVVVPFTLTGWIIVMRIKK